MADAAAAAASGMAAIELGGEPDTCLTAVGGSRTGTRRCERRRTERRTARRSHIEEFAANPPDRARVIPLKVAGAFPHLVRGPRMKPSPRPRRPLSAEGCQFSDDPQRSSMGTAVRSSTNLWTLFLVSQVTNPVRWDLCQETLLASGVTGCSKFPGGTLTGLAKRATKGVEVFPVNPRQAARRTGTHHRRPEIAIREDSP